MRSVKKEKKTAMRFPYRLPVLRTIIKAACFIGAVLIFFSPRAGYALPPDSYADSYSPEVTAYLLPGFKIHRRSSVRSEHVDQNVNNANSRHERSRDAATTPVAKGLELASWYSRHLHTGVNIMFDNPKPYSTRKNAILDTLQHLQLLLINPLYRWNHSLRLLRKAEPWVRARYEVVLDFTRKTAVAAGSVDRVGSKTQLALSNSYSFNKHDGSAPYTRTPTRAPLRPSDTAKILMPPPLGIPMITGALLYEGARWYSNFAINPYDPTIPEAVREVYTWDQLWHPAYNPQHYLQCTAYVAMIYNLNGIRLRGKVRGNARDWINLTGAFAVHKSGVSRETPQVMDIAVWAEGGANHVGVVIDVADNMIRIANANAASPEFTFHYGRDESGAIHVTDSNGNDAASAWVPSHWLRYKYDR